jgi:Acetyltransferase (GNAT) domain
MIEIERQRFASSAEPNDASQCPAIRAYKDGDEHALVRLLGAELGHDVALEHWRWKLLHWPSEAANVWLATVDGQAVFHYGGIPLRYSVNGSVETAMISVDAMTAPQFRRRGLLTQGVARAFTEWQAHGIAFTLGLPNERWHSRTAAAGWQPLFALQWLVRPLRPEVFAARRFGMPWLRRTTILTRVWRGWLRDRPSRDPQIEFHEVMRADGSFDRLWDRCRSDAPFSVVRDSAWVQWRFLSSPARKYQVVVACRGGAAAGYRVIHIAKTQHKTSAFLAELVAPDGDEAAQDSLLAEAVATADHAGADVLATLAVPGTRLHRSLRRAGFLRGPAFGVHVVPFAPSLSLDRLRRPENWRLSGAEFDVV